MTGSAAGRGERGEAGLLLVLLVLTLLTVVGVALVWTTASERHVAANDWAASRALYAADAGARWASVQMRRPGEFLARAEFQPPDPGPVHFFIPSHAHGSLGPFSGDPTEEGIRVEVEAPGNLGSRPCIDPTTGRESGLFFYRFEVRVRAFENLPNSRFAKRIDADVEIGPLPPDSMVQQPGAHPTGPGEGDIIAPVQPKEGVVGGCEPAAFRSVVMNWREP
jgi:hypothetical protein